MPLNNESTIKFNLVKPNESETGLVITHSNKSKPLVLKLKDPT